MRTRTVIPITIKRSTLPITPPTIAINICENERVNESINKISTHTNTTYKSVPISINSLNNNNNNRNEISLSVCVCVCVPATLLLSVESDEYEKQNKHTK
jgi:hypothetical protein